MWQEVVGGAMARGQGGKKVTILNKSSNFIFGEGWGENLRCDELEKIMKDADAKLRSAGAKPTKGLGKGKQKGKHHE